jgi:hypothetical protein
VPFLILEAGANDTVFLSLEVDTLPAIAFALEFISCMPAPFRDTGSLKNTLPFENEREVEF